MRTFAAIVLSVALISSANAQTSESANYKLPACRDFNAMANEDILSRLRPERQPTISGRSLWWSD